MLSTDEMEYGINYGDSIKDIRYGYEYIEIDFPGGIADIENLEFN